MSMQTNVVPISAAENLDGFAARGRKALADAACGPLVLARDVVVLAERWDAHREEAGGLECTTWLVKVFGEGKNLAFFVRRHEAVEALGEHARRTWHHEAAHWAVSRYRDRAALRKLDAAVLQARKANGSNPLTRAQVIRLASKVFGAPAKAAKPAPGVVTPATCERCAVLEDFIRTIGLEVPE